MRKGHTDRIQCDVILILVGKNSNAEYFLTGERLKGVGFQENLGDLVQQSLEVNKQV